MLMVLGYQLEAALVHALRIPIVVVQEMWQKQTLPNQ